MNVNRRVGHLLIVARPCNVCGSDAYIAIKSLKSRRRRRSHRNEFQFKSSHTPAWELRLQRSSVAGRWNIWYCIPTLERGNDKTFVLESFVLESNGFSHLLKQLKLFYSC